MGYKYESWVTLGGSLSRFFNVENRKDSFPEAKYHTSWDWLMPVVEKIEKLGFIVEILISTNTMQQCNVYGREDFTELTVEAKSKIETVYRAVTEFIQWYNTQKS